MLMKDVGEVFGSCLCHPDANRWQLLAGTSSTNYWIQVGHVCLHLRPVAHMCGINPGCFKALCATSAGCSVSAGHLCLVHTPSSANGMGRIWPGIHFVMPCNIRQLNIGFDGSGSLPGWCLTLYGGMAVSGGPRYGCCLGRLCPPHGLLHLLVAGQYILTKCTIRMHSAIQELSSDSSYAVF
jgi:hypothetical protein